MNNILTALRLTSAAALLFLTACSDTPAAPAAPPASPPPATECTEQGSVCIRFGQVGTCLGERCVLASGFCSYDEDCEDQNPCSRTSCDEGVCSYETAEAACDYDGEAGTCYDGRCTAAPTNTVCEDDDDCPDNEGACFASGCADSVCIRAPLPDGSECEMPSARRGVCRAEVCVASLEGEALNERVCENVPTRYGGMRRRCRGGTRFRLPDPSLAAAEIAAAIRDHVHYETFVSLVPLADGGYNILVFNTKDRSSVQGLIDPSLIAWEVGTLTKRTDWRSRNLQVWVDPYDEGWQILASGGREAITRGRRSAGFLGRLGVVNMPEFRRWLAANFVRLQSPDATPENVSLPQ